MLHQSLVFCLLGALSAGAGAVEAALAKRLADDIQGKLVVNGGGLYYAARVAASFAPDGELSIKSVMLPVFKIDTSAGPMNAGRSRHVNLSIAAEAICGDPTLHSANNRSQLAVWDGKVFLPLPDQGPVKDVPGQEAVSPPIHISKADLARATACSESLQAKLALLPFESIRLFSGKEIVLDVVDPLSAELVVEREPGEELPVTHVEIMLKAGMGAPLSVEVQSSSVMNCSWEGPHIELDSWKRGYTTVTRLRQAGNKFMLPLASATPAIPAFPAYTPHELRRAINAHYGKTGLASAEQAAPCAPMLRAQHFKVRYGARLIQEITLQLPGGC
jgi:hypothetical protein